MTSKPKNETPDLDGATCYVCRTGHLSTGTYTNTFEKNGSVVVVKDIPGWVCDSCGEGYADAATTKRVLRLANNAFERGVEVEVLRFSTPSDSKQQETTV